MIDLVEELRIWAVNTSDKAAGEVFSRAADTVEHERAQRAIANMSWYEAAKAAIETGDTHALQCWCDAADGKL